MIKIIIIKKLKKEKRKKRMSCIYSKEKEKYRRSYKLKEQTIDMYAT